jgi:hypothetical protein
MYLWFGMKKGMTFKERAKIGKEIIARQPQLTPEQALASVKRVHDRGLFHRKKKGARGNPK